MTMSYRVAFRDLPWEECASGIRHKVHRRGGQLLRLVEYDASMAPHWCERGHVGTILSGRLEIEFTSGTQVFEPGDGVDIPSGHEHRHMARVLSDRVTALFVEELVV
jgi:mannose-6-phosphate isomerase-like protein (cupin superfamily)